MKTLQKDGRTLQREEIYLDLSKLIEEEKTKLYHLIKYETEISIKEFYSRTFLYHKFGKWVAFNETKLMNVFYEITYPEFLSLFGESELTELPEKWFIRGGEETEEYFIEIGEFKRGRNVAIGYYLKQRKWDWGIAERLIENDYTEITVADYKRLSGSAENAHTENPVSSKMETTGAENAQAEFSKTFLDENPNIARAEIQRKNENLAYAKHLLGQNGYFVFPKAPEGEFPDLSGFEGVNMECLTKEGVSYTTFSAVLKYNNVFYGIRGLE